MFNDNVQFSDQLPFEVGMLVVYHTFNPCIELSISDVEVICRNTSFVLSFHFEHLFTLFRLPWLDPSHDFRASMQKFSSTAEQGHDTSFYH